MLSCSNNATQATHNYISYQEPVAPYLYICKSTKIHFNNVKNVTHDCIKSIRQQYLGYIRISSCVL